MVEIACGLSEHYGVAQLVAVFESDSGEEIRELVILLLRPLFQRMVVAARAGELLAQERLRDILRQPDQCAKLDLAAADFFGRPSSQREMTFQRALFVSMLVADSPRAQAMALLEEHFGGEHLGRLRLTSQGRLISNDVFARFLAPASEDPSATKLITVI